MQAVERIINYDNWITLVVLFSVILLAIMKLIKPNKLLGHTLAFFTPGYFQKKADDNVSFYSPFNLTLFLFTSITISLFFFLTFLPKYFEKSFFNYIVILSSIIIYLFSRQILDRTFSNILGLSIITNYFVISKSGYLSSLSLLLFPFIILYQYAINNTSFLISVFAILFVFRAFLILYNNKKLVLRKLFYFILYFCTLEIAPLLILYKTTTTQ